MHKKFVGCNQLNVTKLSKRLLLEDWGEEEEKRQKQIR